MRLRLTLGLLCCCLASEVAHTEELPIPPLPRDLEFTQDPIKLPTAENRRVQLANGPVVYLAEDHTLPLVEISLALRVGSFLEPEDQAGLGFLTATQLRRGGTVTLDADDFDNRTDLLGARLQSMSGITRSGAGVSVPTWALDEGLELFFSMLTQPAFQEDRLAVSQGNLLESLSRRNEDALEILDREWAWSMYGERHFSTRLMTSASLQAIQHRHLVEFHLHHWRPERMVLAVSGDFDRHALLATMEERFAQWPAADLGSQQGTWPPPSPPTGTPPGLYHYEMDVPQAKVALGHRLSGLLGWDDPDRWALAVVAEILGGQGALSRIAGRLRTAEGLVYRASAQLYPGDIWPGELKIFFESQGASVERAVAATLEEVERIRTEQVHPMELSVVKQSLLARLRLDFDTAEEIAGFFAENELLDRPHSYWQQYLEGVAKITIADVQRAAKTFLQPDSLVFVVVGRWQEISPESRLGLSPLESLVGHSRTRLRIRDPLTLEATPEI